jgi:hypothetical protein
MRTLIFITSFLFFLSNSNAQIVDDFADGDFSSNPTWQGDINNFIINDDFELQLNAPDLGNSSLFVPVQIPVSTDWKFFFNLDFAPSNANKSRIYLQADNTDLLSSNGYFIEIGENGNNDAIHFFKQNGVNLTLLASGSLGSVGSEPALARLKIERTTQGQWSFFTDYTGGNDFELDFEIQDDTWLGGDYYFGFYCEYTISRVDKFFFDDISIQALIPDLEAPKLISVNAISETELQVSFDENLDENALSNSNFSINNGIGNPISTEIGFNDHTLVQLLLNTPLQNQNNYTLTSTNISDEVGNISTSQSIDFSFLKTDIAEAFDILINEILADPTPSIGLPSFEFIELYNHSQKIIDLADYSFDTGGAPKLLSSYLLFPNDYLILCDKDHIASFEPYGDVLGISDFPALVNAGDKLTLTNTFGDVIHAVNYSEEWYFDLDKREGGWTLEMISPNNICEEEDNWRASESLSGGTPGAQNSIFNNFMDEESPDLVRVFVDSQKPNQLQLFFNENMDQANLENIDNYALSNNLEVINAIQQSSDNQKITLVLNESLELKIIYEITLKTAITDCLGNSIGIANTAEFGLPEPYAESDVIINEVLFNPEVGGFDFVELYNSSSKVLNLADLSIGNLQIGMDTFITAITQKFLFLPQTYVVLTESPTYIKNRYQPQNPQWLLDNDLPAFDNEFGNVTLIYASNNTPLIVDAFDYDKDFHHVLLEDENGVSLERINPSAASQESSNWHSAAETVGFATPTYQNSQFLSNTSIPDEMISIPEKSFSPDGDGFQDFLQINYQTDTPDFVANVKIFDTAGRIIKDLVKNELIGTEGFFKWDGSTNENRLARLGVYIIYIQIFSPTGDVKEFKKACALAEKF